MSRRLDRLACGRMADVQASRTFHLPFVRLFAAGKQSDTIKEHYNGHVRCFFESEMEHASHTSHRRRHV